MKRAEIASHGFAFALIAAGLVIATLEVRQDVAWAKRPPAVVQPDDASDEDDDDTPVPLPVRRPDPTKPAADIAMPPVVASPVVAPNVVAPRAPEAPPTDWSDGDRIEALTRCVALLAPLKVKVGEPRSVRQDRCGGPALVEVQAFEIGGNEVLLKPALLANCETAARLHAFIASDLQPLATEVLGSPIVRIEGVGGYQCRGVIGSASSRGLSEHAYANAVDMSAFVTADGRRIGVREDWGAVARDGTQRDSTAAKADDLKATRRDRQTARDADDDADDEDDDTSPPPLPVRNPRLLTNVTEFDRRGRRIRIASEAPPPAEALKPEQPSGTGSKEPAARTFLRRLHTAGCRRFSTALGPEANEAHRDHFHFDLVVRRGRSFCE